MYWPLNTRNFGDAINPIFGEFFSGKKAVNINGKNVTDPAYLCIGSSIQFPKVKTIVWGAGVLTPKWGLASIPQKICAVRGPMTRKYLQNKKIKCPDVYGDPALLCPMIYEPSKSKKYKIGLIPHCVDKHIIKKWNIPNDILIIDIESNFDDVIKKTTSCESIISSSLHGLILADAYGITSSWVTIGGVPIERGKIFKFHDYFKSLNYWQDKPYNLSDGFWNNIPPMVCRQPINLNKLLSSCPFNFKNKTLI